MAKDDCNWTAKLKLVHLILALLVLFGSGVAAWVLQKAETAALGESIVLINEEGSKPAKRHENQLGIIEYRLKTIDTRLEAFSVKQEDMQKENNAAFKEILDRLPPK